MMRALRGPQLRHQLAQTCWEQKRSALLEDGAARALREVQRLGLGQLTKRARILSFENGDMRRELRLEPNCGHIPAVDWVLEDVSHTQPLQNECKSESSATQLVSALDLKPLRC
jgi:hypothetical protein